MCKCCWGIYEPLPLLKALVIRGRGAAPAMPKLQIGLHWQHGFSIYDMDGSGFGGGRWKDCVWIADEAF